MLRQIVTPSDEHYDLHIPKEYINKTVEILVLSVADVIGDENKNIMQAQSTSMQDWENKDDEVWNDMPAIWRYTHPFSIYWFIGS